LRNERQKKIMELIQSKQTLKISELSQCFGVSEMTIHRDIKPLIEEGLIMKTFGGISLGHTDQVPRHDPADCAVCLRKINDRLSYRIILPQNRVDTACCAHCGLIRHKGVHDQVIQALCHDFLYHTTISSLIAWYVMDSSVDMHCCQPQLLAFGRKEDAEKFVKGFGGRVLSFELAMKEVTEAGKGCCEHE